MQSLHPLIVQVGKTTYINVTSDTIVLQDSFRDYVIPPSGLVVSASRVEEPAGSRNGVELLRLRIQPAENSPKLLDELEQRYPGAIIIGDLVAAEAFPGRVLAPVWLHPYKRAKSFQFITF